MAPHVPREYKLYTAPASLTATDPHFTKVPLEKWADFESYIRDCAQTEVDPAKVFRYYCRSLAAIFHAKKVPDAVKNYAKLLKDFVTSTARSTFCEIANVACEERRAIFAKSQMEHRLKRSTYLMIGDIAEGLAGENSKRRRRGESPELSSNDDKGDETSQMHQKARGQTTANKPNSKKKTSIKKVEKLVRCDYIVEQLTTKATRPFDKKLLAEKILRLSSRQLHPEPSQIKNLLFKLDDSSFKGIIEKHQSLPNHHQALSAEGKAYLMSFKGMSVPQIFANTFTFPIPPGEIDFNKHADLIYIRRTYEHFVSGLFGSKPLQETMTERTWTGKFIIPLFDWLFVDCSFLSSSWCERGDFNDVTTKKPYFLYDGNFRYIDDRRKFSMFLVEVSGGSDQTSDTKNVEDLEKLMISMKKNLTKMASTMQGTSLEQCQNIVMIGAQIIGNVAHLQAMRIVDGVYIGWEWAEVVIPRNEAELFKFDATLKLLFTLKAVLLENYDLLRRIWQAEALLEDFVPVHTGLTPPQDPTRTAWQEML